MSPSFLLYSSAFTKWPGSGKTTLDFIVRMLLGHTGCSLCTSSNISTVKGLEFTIASVSARSVFSDSWFRDLPCVSNKNISIVCDDRICLSQTPTIWLHAGGFLYQLMLSALMFWRKNWISWWSVSLYAFSNSFCASSKLEPLSLRNTLIFPLRATNRRRACMKESVSRLQVHSIWTALLDKHVHSAPYYKTQITCTKKCLYFKSLSHRLSNTVSITMSKKKLEMKLVFLHADINIKKIYWLISTLWGPKFPRRWYYHYWWAWWSILKVLKVTSSQIFAIS